MRPKTINRVLMLAMGIASFGVGASALAEGVGVDTKVEQKTTTTVNKRHPKKDTDEGGQKTVAADDTAINKRDRAESAPTADQQKNNKSDVELAAEIRRAVVKDTKLSTNAHNIKIIVAGGEVTLKGPVASQTEKASVEKKAHDIAGTTKVTSEIDIAK